MTMKLKTDRWKRIFNACVMKISIPLPIAKFDFNLAKSRLKTNCGNGNTDQYLEDKSLLFET